ncbi:MULTISPECIES: DsbA family protein [Nitrospirillum]|uniref:Protein-disulfide isomerase n=1 Tax=Nitrospirillum amazonense TaxID=28077 RepID=A0A560G7I2_9PROT|nr:DsbA family protein [Nitrospirillum amazonense]MEC4590289.1 DsbA family protein [Nitrospirillum amazonense]TWB29784.1 protein-disulfide isomerase [Nitrospirillum amazonense]
MRTALSALITSCLLLAGTAAQAGQQATRQPDDLDTRIHAYLLAHPEVLTEMQQALAAKQAAERDAQTRATLAANHDALLADAGDTILGNPKGDVTIVEFFDDECPYCKMMAPTLEAVVKTDPGVRVVLKELAVLGPGSEIAARYALAAQQQGKYLVLHAALMADKTPEHQLTEARVKEIAAGVGLDTARLERDGQSADIVVRLQRTRALAQTIGIRGTPGLVIGDTVHSGAMTPDALVKAIAAARAAKAP